MPGNPVVILTQEEDDNARLAQLLSDHGISAMSYPCIATRLLPFDPARLPGGRGLGDYHILAFTSRRGVAGVAAAAAQLRRHSPVIACVGEATAETAEQLLGLPASIVPEQQTGEGLARAIIAEFKQPVPLLLVRGTKTSGTLQRAMQSAGWDVDEIVVYENISPQPEPLGRIQHCSAAFASPSAAECFFAANPGLKEACTCVAIGELTASRLSELGATEIITARRPSIEGLATALVELSNKESTT